MAIGHVGWKGWQVVIAALHGWEGTQVVTTAHVCWEGL
jgi:hypothetical protein